jgi:putative nucleotidyltransferase with HDIG domain
MNTQTAEFEFIKALSAELSSRNLVFPTSLKATMNIRQALDNPDISNDQVAKLISMEPVLSAQILMLANTPMFNRSSKKIDELKTAVGLMGFGVVRNVAISVGMKQLKDQQAHGQNSALMEGLWTRSIRVAALAFVIARNRTRVSPDKAMIAGLLHDIGKFYILSRICQYEDLLHPTETMWDLIDHWHVDIGTAILDSWEVADDIRSAVMDHKNTNLPENIRPNLTDVLVAADFLDEHFVKESLENMDENSLPISMKNLNLDIKSIDVLLSETRQEIAQILKMLS